MSARAVALTDRLSDKIASPGRGQIALPEPRQLPLQVTDHRTVHAGVPLACFTVPSHDDDCGCSRWRHRSSDGHAVSVQSTSNADRPAHDRWANWILQQRFGGDPEQRDRVLGFLAPIRDTVLSGAALQPGDVVLDVGCGDGLLGFGALDLVGPTGRVVFSDVSTDLLEQCTRLLDRAGDGRGSTVEAALPDLAAVGDQATDVVVLRSVLIYVHDKARAFQALHRVLRPGGRLSLFEPINSFGFPEPDGYLWGFNMFGLEEQAAKVHTAYTETVDTGDGDPMLGFDERDLLRWAEQAGFTTSPWTTAPASCPPTPRPGPACTPFSPRPRTR